MRVVVLFDLPVVSAKNRRDYAAFRKFLIKSGFLMMQESVYCKIAQNITMADSIVDNIRKNKPEEGLIQVIKLTEKQFTKIEYILGSDKSEVLNSDERLVVI